MCVCSSLVRLLFGSSFEKSDDNQIRSKLQYGFLHILMRSKVMYQGQGLSEVKLGGKCWFFVSPAFTGKTHEDRFVPCFCLSL